MSAVYVHELLDRQAERRPDAPAVRAAAESLTYGELTAASRRFATWLADRGVRRGDRVLVRHPNAVPVPVALYAVARLGAVLVPISPAMSRFQLRSVIADADPRLVLTTADEAAELREETGREVVPLADAWAQSRELAPASDRAPALNDLFLLIYTSGSTSTPKGVMCPHREVSFALHAVASRLAYRPDDAVLCRVPLSFDYGLYQALLCAEAGAELLLVPDGEDTGLLRRIRERHATVVPVVPSLASMLVALAGRDRRHTEVRLFTNTGAALGPALAPRLREGFPGARVCLMFGITECKRVSIMEPDGDLDRPGALGRPLPGTEVVVVDAEGRPLPAGEVGELVVRGRHVMRGYWRAGHLSRERFRDLPWGRELRTGDYGWLDDDGYLYFAGRRDDVFKSNGVRVSTVEIEAAAVDVPFVRAAAVLPPAEGRGATLFVVSDETAERVLAELRERLESAKVPRLCHVLESLPVNGNGKVDRNRLGELAAAGLIGQRQ